MQNKIHKIPEKPVVIVGGGWSGLATACYLAEQNIPVTLIESAKQLGGRARKSTSRTQILDNGQHLMLGAYSEMLDLLRRIGIKEDDVFFRSQQHLKLLNAKYLHTILDLKLPAMAKPYNLLFGLLFSKGLRFKEKLIVLYRFDKLLKTPVPEDKDVSVTEWLKDADLPTNYILFLNALCLAAMNTSAGSASAMSFQNVLNETFNGEQGSTDLLIPAVNLGSVLPLPASIYLAKKQAKVLNQTKATSLQLDNNTVTHIVTADKTFAASAVVLATPAHITSQLLKPAEDCNELCHNLDQFRYESITTVYLRYNDHCQIPEKIIGLTGSLSEWVFDRSVADQPGMIAVVISCSDSHREVENKDLCLTIRNELAVVFPHWPKPSASWVIREKRATFLCTPEANQHRPGSATPLDNLFLSGDYLATDKLFLPATLETSIRNAKASAEEVVNYLNRQNTDPTI
ncbi:MAG: hydroxysqualene dehydroxylase HpnE [Gammaproteobacteria bacterium]|nr:hydroxysqualene dehydroxylase HpnE [Gammaproteobacteria bacterium]